MEREGWFVGGWEGGRERRRGRWFGDSGIFSPNPLPANSSRSSRLRRFAVSEFATLPRLSLSILLFPSEPSLTSRQTLSLPRRASFLFELNANVPSFFPSLVIGPRSFVMTFSKCRELRLSPFPRLTALQSTILCSLGQILERLLVAWHVFGTRLLARS